MFVYRKRKLYVGFKKCNSPWFNVIDFVTKFTAVQESSKNVECVENSKIINQKSLRWKGWLIEQIFFRFFGLFYSRCLFNIFEKCPANLQI